MKHKMAATTALALFALLFTLAGSARAQGGEPQGRGGVMGAIFGSGKKKPQQQPTSPTMNGGAATGVAPNAADRIEPDDTNRLANGVSEDTQANRRDSMSEEEAAVVPYYNNFMTNYRFGPEDVISIRVFGQDRYSVIGATVPPDGYVAHPLIPDGIFVVGKTRKQIQEEVMKLLDEYIIDPRISVSLDKGQSARYFILGDIAQPGARLMTRRLSVGEAIAEAGGVLPTGSKKNIVILRRDATGNIAQIRVNLARIEKGQAPDASYLSPGDQIVVPGNTMKKVQSLLNLVQIVSFARMFGGF